MSSYYGEQFEARRATQEEFEQLLFEHGIITNGSEIDIPNLSAMEGSTVDDAFVGPPAPETEQNLTSPQFMANEYGVARATKMTPQEVYADLGTGASWVDRLADAFLFDEESTSKWMLDKYGPDHVFVGTDDALYFLPPQELERPLEDRQWVRFDPEGLDSGDVVAFVPQVLAGAAAAAALAVAAPETILGTMLVGGVGGVVGEAGVQGVGAAIGDEGHVPLSERANRAVIAGGMEAAGAGVGEVVTRGAGAVKDRIVKAVTSDIDPAVHQSRKELSERAIQDFTVGTETGSPGIQTTERMLRQNVLSQDLASRRDREIADMLHNQAKRLIHSLARGGGLRGPKAAAAAVSLRLQHLKEIRSGLWRGFFDKAIDIAGNRKVASTSHLRRTLKEILAEEMSHVPGADRRAIMSYAQESLDALPAGRTTIRKLQTSLADARVAAEDARGLVEKLESPIQGKRIASLIEDALHKDLNDTINRVAADAKPEVMRGLLRGETDAGGALREVVDADVAGKAGALLEKARSEYARMSAKIREVMENPLAEYIEDPEGLIREILTQSDNPENVQQIMRFLDEFSPTAANTLRARIMEVMLYKTGRGTGEEAADVAGKEAADYLTRITGDEVSPAKLATFATRYRSQMRALFAGNPKAMQRYNDFTRSAKDIAESGRLQGAQTFPIMFANWATKFIGAPALIGSAAYSQATDGDLSDELVALGAAIFSARALTHALFRTELSRKYSRLMKAMARKTTGRLSPGAKRALKQTIIDISREVAGLGYDRDAEEEPPLVLTPTKTDEFLTETPYRTQQVMEFAPGGI